MIIVSVRSVKEFVQVREWVRGGTCPGGTCPGGGVDTGVVALV